jgi:hypothetical protein
LAEEAAQHPPRFSLSRDVATCDAMTADSAMEVSLGCWLAEPAHLEDDLDIDLLHLTRDAAQSGPRGRGRGPVLFNLSEHWLAAVNYHHAQPPELAASRELRATSYSAVSAEDDRDIVDLKLSWTLWRNEVDLGYRFQSTRADDGVGGPRYSVWRLIGSEDQLHGVSIGFTRRFGRTD